jgi:DNA primase
MRLDTMEKKQRREPDAGDISEAEREEVEVEENVVEDVAQDLLRKVVSKIGARERIEVPMYEGNLEVEEFLDWVRSMDKYIDYKDVKEDNMVNHIVTRLKGHVALWWDELQVECRRNGK